jgi:protein gp37
MGDKTAIEWTQATWNPVRGCTRVSPGCGGPGKEGGCYAERTAARFSALGQPYDGFAERRNGEARWTGKVALIEQALTFPLRLNKPRLIFVNSMSDLFHESLPEEAINRVFAVMASCPQHNNIAKHDCQR